jgi:hypothetical protein
MVVWPKPHNGGQLALELFGIKKRRERERGKKKDTRHDVSVNHMWRDGAEHVVSSSSSSIQRGE